MIFHLETEFFSWDFVAWAVNFLLAALLIIVVTLALRGRAKLSVTQVTECEGEVAEAFIPDFEKRLKLFRTRTVDVWLEYSWPFAVAPFFFLALFLTAVFK